MASVIPPFRDSLTNPRWTERRFLELPPTNWNSLTREARVLKSRR